MTPLEKAARALEPVNWDRHPSNRPYLIERVKPILTAIREPSERGGRVLYSIISNAATDQASDDYVQAEANRAFTAMIDHILEGGE